MCDQKNGGDHDDDVDELSASDESEPEERLSSAAFVPELDEDDDDDDDDDREVVTSAPAVGAQSPFSLRGGGAAFSDRSHSIFDCLDSVSRLTSSSSSSPMHEKVTDGVFTRPLPPPPSRKTSQPQSSCPTPAKKKGAPDYLVHPERWTHYSLEDVSETSDQGNSRAAFNYLSSLQQRKEQQESPSDDSCNTQHKMIFRPCRPQKEQPADQSSAVRSREKETRLSHLEEEDEEEEGKEGPHAGGRRIDQRVEKTEDKDRRGAVGQVEEKKQVEKEKVDEKQEKVEEGNPSFTSFRKIKHKNYRKSSGQEDN